MIELDLPMLPNTELYFNKCCYSADPTDSPTSITKKRKLSPDPRPSTALNCVEMEEPRTAQQDQEVVIKSSYRGSSHSGMSPTLAHSTNLSIPFAKEPIPEHPLEQLLQPFVFSNLKACPESPESTACSTVCRLDMVGDDCFGIILSFLHISDICRNREVCDGFNVLCGSVLQKIRTIHSKHSGIPEKHFADVVCRKFQHIRKLDISLRLSTAQTKTLVGSCRHLESLFFHGSDNDDCPHMLLSHLFRLQNFKVLKLVGCVVPPDIWNLSKSRTLEELHLFVTGTPHTRAHTDDRFLSAVTGLLGCCPQLKSVLVFMERSIFSLPKQRNDHYVLIDDGEGDLKRVAYDPPPVSPYRTCDYEGDERSILANSFWDLLYRFGTITTGN